MKTWDNAFKTLFYGPGWQPGTPRLGDLSSLPDKAPERRKYNPKIPEWVEIYLVVHFAILSAVQQKLSVEYVVSCHVHSDIA